MLFGAEINAFTDHNIDFCIRMFVMLVLLPLLSDPTHICINVTTNIPTVYGNISLGSDNKHGFTQCTVLYSTATY